MNIALDYDGTYTNDTLLWKTFISICKYAYHKVIIVTARNKDLDENEELRELAANGVRVIYCDGVAKKHVILMLQSRGEEDLKIDIWIDDKPESIVSNSPTTLESLKLWRATRQN